MKISEMKQWDAAEHLDTPEAQAEFLSMVLTDGDADEIRAALNVVVRARGMAELARAAGVSRERLYETLGKGGNPAFGTVLAITRAMGISLACTVSPAPKNRQRRKRTKAA